MASEASWQTSAQGSDAFTTEEPMDQRTVEVLLRRLVERVEESERRYGEALGELHARLDQLSLTAETARDAGPPDDADTFDRLHTQVSNLARRLEQETAPLDDFERLGRALTDSLNHGAKGDEAYAAERPHTTAEPSPFAQAAMAAKRQAEPTPAAGYPDFGYAPASGSSLPPLKTEDFGGAAAVDKRLMEIAQRLEESIGAAMPTGAIEAINRKLDDIGSQLSQALGQAPAAESVAHVQRQISDIGQQLARAEEQLGKIGGIEGHLLGLIERLDEKSASRGQPEAAPAQLQEIAGKAAAEAARLVADETKRSSERLDAMHRDITAMSSKSRESGDRLVKTLEAVHESLKRLVQQVERGAPALQPKPRAPFGEKTRHMEAKPGMPLAQAGAAGLAPAAEKPTAAKSGASGQPAAKKETLRDRLGAAIPDFAETDVPPPFGRSKRPSPDERAVDLDATQPLKARIRAEAKPPAADASLGNDLDAPDDLVAAARRAAQAAALRAEERSGRRTSSYLAGSTPGAEQSGHRKRSLLMIAAAVLLALSAALLVGRLVSKPEEEATVPAAEESMPTPGDAEGATAPEGEGIPPADVPDKSGAWDGLPIDPAGNASRQGATTGFTEIAKSPARPMPASELAPEPQLASLKPGGQAALPPGVIFSIEDPALQTKPEAAPQIIAGTTPLADLPLPPAALGPKALREAAKAGDAKAQYAVATRYAEGKGVSHDLKAAAQWFEQAAASGLAPAQYRLAAMYERGLGVDKDAGKARSWYAAAAANGNVKAMHNLAVSASGRQGGEADYALAAKWYGEAAAYGLADSQFNLGILAEHGLGVAKSLEDAYKWFALAAAKGDIEAAKRREVIRVQLEPSTLAAADAAVKAWKPKDAILEANEVAEQSVWGVSAPKTGNTALVTRAQSLLNKLGYDVGPPDGVAGERTQTAIKLFERRNGLEETGAVTLPLVTQLERLTS